jgi:class 3 adenylate cyclase
MGVAGIAGSRTDHVDAVLQLAIELQKVAREFDEPDIGELRLRIGISTGAVVTGIIGETRLAYDLWGDTVNLAARLESQGVAGEIQVCGAVVAQASARFHFRSRGRLSVKGRGRMETWLLTPTPAQWKRPLVLLATARRNTVIDTRAK